MERLGKPGHGRQGRRVSEREASESNPVETETWISRDPSTSLRMAVRNDKKTRTEYFDPGLKYYPADAV